jgi:NADPH-dependent 2,4-dienoyl-CoA reductase/sulfur reductase-like enzyme
VNGDVVVVGGGLIGCAAAVAIADRGAKVTLVTQRREGAASAAAAGLLAPSIEPPPGEARTIAFAARDMDYQVVVVRDGLTGYEPQRTFFTDQVFPRMCRVRTVDEVVAMFDKATA